MAKFRVRPHEFEAIQFTGENWVEMTVFCGTHTESDGEVVPIFQLLHYTLALFTTMPNGKATLWSESRKAEVYVKVGDWIVKGREGFEAVGNESFQQVYEEVT